MPRVARIVVEGYPHHITQRGNYRQTVFSGSKDYRFYLDRLNEYLERYELSVLAYCLMPNHVHFVAIPEEKDSMAKTFNACHMRYAHYFNKKNGVTGHLWQGRFYSCVLDDAHLYAAIRYVENNPVRAGLVKRAWDWEWSSAREHVLKKRDGKVKLRELKVFIEITDWETYLTQEDKTSEIEAIRKHTLTGRPLGRESFVSGLENRFGKRLRALPRGRPRHRPEG